MNVPMLAVNPAIFALKEAVSQSVPLAKPVRQDSNVRLAAAAFKTNAQDAQTPAMVSVVWEAPTATKAHGRYSPHYLILVHGVFF